MSWRVDCPSPSALDQRWSCALCFELKCQRNIRTVIPSESGGADMRRSESRDPAFLGTTSDPAKFCSRQTWCVHERTLDLYFRIGPVSKNDFTTILFGCWPTGIIVSREYSVGSSRRGLLF